MATTDEPKAPAMRAWRVCRLRGTVKVTSPVASWSSADVLLAMHPPRSPRLLDNTLLRDLPSHFRPGRHQRFRRCWDAGTLGTEAHAQRVHSAPRRRRGPSGCIPRRARVWQTGAEMITETSQGLRDGMRSPWSFARTSRLALTCAYGILFRSRPQVKRGQPIRRWRSTQLRRTLSYYYARVHPPRSWPATAAAAGPTQT
jgi:hypothetical protein